MVHESFSLVQADKKEFKPLLSEVRSTEPLKLIEPITVPNCRYIMNSREPENMSGASGGVFYGYDTVTGDEIVIKVAKPYTHLEADYSEHHPFVAEYKALKKIEDLEIPNVVRAREYTYIKAEDGVTLLPVVVLERVKGKSLADYEFQGINDLLIKHHTIANAIDEMNQLGILHRDLSPRHVVVSNKGIKILDLGLSNLVLPDTPNNREYMVGSIGFSDLQTYSPNHMPAIDRWAFMSLLYHSFTGDSPFINLKEQHTTIDYHKYLNALRAKRYISMGDRENKLNLTEIQIEKLDKYFKDFFVGQYEYRDLNCVKLLEEVYKCLN